MRAVEIRPLTKCDWAHVEALFGSNGACGGCWCMYWRVPSTGRYWTEKKGEPNRRAFESLVRSGNATGLLAFRSAGPVGWCSVGPREAFPYLSRARNIPAAAGPQTWSITCIFILRQERRQGVGSLLVREAADYARDCGACWVEGYPSKIRADVAPDAFVHTGTADMFQSAGFERAGTLGARELYRKRLAQRVER